MCKTKGFLKYRVVFEVPSQHDKCLSTVRGFDFCIGRKERQSINISESFIHQLELKTMKKEFMSPSASVVEELSSLCSEKKNIPRSSVFDFRNDSRRIVTDSLRLYAFHCPRIVSEILICEFVDVFCVTATHTPGSLT